VLRKILAVFLVFSWVSLSGFDLSEDFDVSVQVGVHHPSETSAANGPGVDLVNDLLESGDRTRLSQVGLHGLPFGHLSAGGHIISKKVAKLHKLHRVFLI
jgi:hypothetical protein